MHLPKYCTNLPKNHKSQDGDRIEFRLRCGMSGAEDNREGALCFAGPACLFFMDGPFKTEGERGNGKIRMLFPNISTNLA
jgi:hypothetical protein